jgi:hypothetical protein
MTRVAAGKRVTIRHVLISVLWVAGVVLVALVYCTVKAAVGPNSARAISARRLQCAINLKMIGVVIQIYEAQHKGKLPAYPRTGVGMLGLSWRVLLLPLIDQSEQSQFDRNEAWDSVANAHLLNHVPSDFVCPCHSDSTERAGSSYVAVVDDEPSDSDQVPDVIGVLETESKLPWTKPAYLWISDIPQAVNDNYSCENGFHLLLANGEIHYFARGSDVSGIGEMIQSAVGKPQEDIHAPIFHR